MLSTSIRHASEFDAVFQRGKRFTEACFSFYYLKTERDHPRLGMVISKRNCALAVNRNRIKRVIREKFRLSQHKLPAIDLVVLLKSSSQKKSDQALCAYLETLFLQLTAHCGGSLFSS